MDFTFGEDFLRMSKEVYEVEQKHSQYSVECVEDQENILSFSHHLYEN